MKVITPLQLAEQTGSKYLGVLVAAKFARSLNEFRRHETYEEVEADVTPREKMTTTALGVVADGEAHYQLIERRRPGT